MLKSKIFRIRMEEGAPEMGLQAAIDLAESEGFELVQIQFLNKFDALLIAKTPQSDDAQSSDSPQKGQKNGKK